MGVYTRNIALENLLLNVVFDLVPKEDQSCFVLEYNSLLLTVQYSTYIFQSINQNDFFFIFNLLIGEKMLVEMILSFFRLKMDLFI